MRGMISASAEHSNPEADSASNIYTAAQDCGRKAFLDHRMPWGLCVGRACASGLCLVGAGAGVDSLP